VQALHNAAHDGDTITLPAGTFSWTTRVEITKGITLQGQTTIAHAGTAKATSSDLTRIQDNTPRRGTPGIISVTIGANQSFRLTGISFVPGATASFSEANGAIILNGSDNAAVTNVRVDNCHFAKLYQGKILLISGWLYGVADHNLIECRPGGSFSFEIWNGASYGGSTQYNGNGAWADYPWFGTDKFFFIETNTIVNAGAQETTNATIDSYFGGRWVARHNYFINTAPSTHGTEGGSFRGQRACEIYDNIFDLRIVNNGIGQRSGTSLIHDNRFIGIEPALHQLCSLNNYRQTPARSRTVWGIADGTSVWDQNDTQGNGTFVQGRPPFVFSSGTATSSTRFDQTHIKATLTDSSKNWLRNRWVGYSIKNTNRASASYGLGSYIISNTSNTIIYRYYPGNDTPAHLIFNPGDTYQIHRVLTMMDQNGRGKGDQVTGDPPTNRTVGRPLWPHQALEPCYSWNNIYSPTNQALGFRTHAAQPTTKLGIDYFNLGGGFPADTTPRQVSSFYTAAVNGVDYVGPFTYPHPLTLSAGAVVSDFNGDGSPDFVLQNASTRQTWVWYMDNNVRINSASGPTPPGGWTMVSVADFNLDGHPDYLLFNPGTGQTAIWYFNNNVHVSSALGPTIWAGWNVAGVADFNNDGHPDYLLFRPSTGGTAIWYLNNNVRISSAFGPTIWAGWNVAGVADFNNDGHPDYLLFRPSTEGTAIWYLDDNVRVFSAFGPTTWAGWSLVAP
jgi:hypothetical protein